MKLKEIYEYLKSIENDTDLMKKKVKMATFYTGDHESILKHLEASKDNEEIMNTEADLRY